jgi:hypothetical protein
MGKQGKVACCAECGKPLNQLRAIESEVNLGSLNFSIMH